MISRFKNISRRSLLKMGLLTVPSWSLAGSRKQMDSQLPVGVQLWCVRKQLSQDMPGTLAKLAEIGFQAVEFENFFGHSASDIRQMLDANQLQACGSHIYLEDVLGEKLEATVDFHRTIGNKNLIVRWLGEERRSSPETFAHTIELFNQASEALETHGMRVGYHNHDYIFKKFEDKMLWNILADETPESVILQLDTGNASRAGVDVIPLLERNRGRTITAHIKPFSRTDPKAYIGSDDLDWKKIISLMKTVGGTEWFIIEYEEEGIPPLQALHANLERFKEIEGGG